MHEPTTYPQLLVPVKGPLPAAKVLGAALGMGEHGPTTRALARRGTLQPDLMTGFTLYLLAGQPRSARSDGPVKRGAPGVAGRIWVRERATFHRPIAASDPFVVEGASVGRHVAKGRRYGTTESTTRDSAGRLVSTNLTTGLLAYRVVKGLADGFEGRPPTPESGPEPDWSVAVENPHLDALASARVGEVLETEPFPLTLDLMRARDTEDPENPIHSDPEMARAAGLRRPIAGGSHVQAFALELVMQRFGPEVLLHGALVDCRWKAPTEDGARVAPRAEVTAALPDRVELSLAVRLAGGPLAMEGRVVVPRPR